MPASLSTLPVVEPGTAVRIAFDEGPLTIGYVDGQPTTRDDGVRMFPVDFEPNDPTSEPVVLPDTVLVAVCEWTLSIVDSLALACSDPLPGVRQAYDIPCHFDATRQVIVGQPNRDDVNAVSAPMFMCAEHAVMTEHEAQADGVASEVQPLV